MRYFNFFVILCLLTFVSCNSNGIKKPKKPKNLISKAEMANILYDMSILTASKGINKKLLEEKGILPETFVYEKYGIDSIQFAMSNEYYAYNLDTYEQIYNKVKDRLALEKTHLDSLNNIEAEQKKLLRDQMNTDSETQNVENNIKKLIESSEISTDTKKNIIPFSEEISMWNKYVSGLGLDPVIVDNEAVSPDGNRNMSSVRLNLGGGFTRSDRSAIVVPALPLEEGDYVYSFWVKAKSQSDVGKTIRIMSEIQGGVEKIYTLSNELKRISVKNQILKKGTCNFLIEIRGEVTNSSMVEFYLWGVQFEKSDEVTKYAPKIRESELDIKFD